MTQTFRLDSVLKLRQRERDQAGKDVADAVAAIALLDTKLSEIAMQQRQLESLRRDFSQGSISTNRMLDAERYQLVLAAQHAHVSGDRSLLVQELDRRRAKLVIRQQAVKALEKLEQRHDERFAEEQRKRQQLLLDEWSQAQTSIAIRSDS
ncbi:MAG: flagellar export protein FliJ [Planctomycetota bacterium]|jgi:flagellar export protein FliJ